MSTLATLVLSVAVHVIGWLEPTTHDSAAFGDSTATDGAWLSIGTVPGAPAATGSGLLLQSRSWTVPTAIDPEPPASELVTATLNRLPVSAVGPQPLRIVPSIVYEPPPLSMTSIV